MTLKDLKQESDKESLDKYTDEIELNEKHLSLIYDTLSDAIFLLAVEPDDRFRFVSVNLAFLANTGLSREQVVSKRIEQVLPETAHALVISKYKEAISENKTVFWEEISAYPTSERVAAVTVTPVCNAEGVCTHLVGTVHDLTECKRAEEALRESEQRIRNLMESVPVGISISTPEGDVLEVNKAIWNIFGYDSKEEFVNMPAEAHYYNSKDRERFVKLHTKGLVKGLELQFKHKDGSVFWASISSAMITTETGNTEFINTFEDITKHKQAEEAHSESEQKIRNLMESVPVGILISTPEGDVLEVNKAILNIFGYDSKEEFVNMPAEAHYYNSKDRERYLKLNKKGLVKGLELQFKHKDGSIFWASITAEMVTTETGNTEFINTFEDITERKQAEEALQDSEGKYRSLIESSKDSIYLVDRDCRYLFVNPKFLSVFGGLPLNKVIGRVHGEFSNVEDTKLFAEKVEEVFKTGKHVSYEHRNTKDNRYVLRTLSPIKDSKGKTTAVTVISKGITERKRMEEALRESDERLRTIIDNLQLGVVIIDAETHEIIDVNPKAINMIDAPKAEIIGQICHKYICQAEVGKCPISDLGQKMDHSEQELINAKGEIIPVLKTVVPTIFNGRRCLVDSFADITRQKQAEKELRTLNQELEQRVSERTKQLKISKDALLNLVDDLNLTTENLKSANERLLELDHMKSMFIASTSHELRTPLNSIIGFSSILLEGWEGELKPKQKEELQLIHTAGKQLLALINDIIDISKIEAGKLETDIREFGLKDVIDEAVSIVKNSIDEKGLDLKMEVEDTTITSDRRRLLQCLLNLLSNAVKFTDKGMITLHATNINNMTNISIIDTGTGIMPDDIKKLFAPFVRLESSLSAKTQGTGLGLYLTKKLTEDVLDGTVGVTSEYGTGSTFTLNIPVKLEKQDKGVE